MPNLRNRFPARRRFLKQSAALTASASLAAPMLVVAHSSAPDAGDRCDACAAPTTAATAAPATAAGATPAAVARPQRTPR
jgi:hypothetical protein